MSKRQPILSIIVPLYKVEAYVEKCITSIVTNAGFEDLCEVILVDDGSPDNSLELAIRALGENANYLVISQENAGLSVARNVGAAQAHGEYIWFVDSDDWILGGVLEHICETIELFERPDIVNISFHMSDGSRTPVANNSPAYHLLRGIDFLDHSIIQSPAQYYIFNHSFYTTHKLHFQGGIYHEDTLFTPQALSLAAGVVRIDRDCYVYNLRDGSIMRSGNERKHVQDLLEIYQELECFRNRSGIGRWERKVLAKYSALCCGSIYYYWKKLPIADRIAVSRRLGGLKLHRAIFASGMLKFLVAVLRMRLFLLVRSNAPKSA